MYKDYLENMQKRFLAKFEEIEVGHNFDYGTEFEIALCHALQTVLPNRFGITRGYALNANGEFSGDDILIHDPMTHPRLNARTVQSFARKEKIPIEGVYSYIEAKHTIQLDGSGPQSLKKATEQVSNVKGLVAGREKRLLNEVVDGVTFSGRFVRLHENVDCWNPPHGMVFARKVKFENDYLTGEQIFKRLGNTTTRYLYSFPPDLIVLGDDILIIPCIREEEHPIIPERLTFADNNHREFEIVRRDGAALALGVVLLLNALRKIRLKPMNWSGIFNSTNA